MIIARTAGKVMFSQACVILFTRGVYPSMHMGRGSVSQDTHGQGVSAGVCAQGCLPGVSASLPGEGGCLSAGVSTQSGVCMRVSARVCDRGTAYSCVAATTLPKPDSNNNITPVGGLLFWLWEKLWNYSLQCLLLQTMFNILKCKCFWRNWSRMYFRTSNSETVWPVSWTKVLLPPVSLEFSLNSVA